MAQLTLAYSNGLRLNCETKKKRFAKCESLSANSERLPLVVQKVWLLYSKRPLGAEVVEELVDRLLRDVE